jgi:hypothetical protein
VAWPDDGFGKNCEKCGCLLQTKGISSSIKKTSSVY